MDEDTELTAADLQRLRKLEDLMISRGFVRDKYGFWQLPGAATTLQAIEPDVED